MRPPVSAVPVRGPRCLRLATALLQRMRLSSPSGGIWEAADVQWWSRQERPGDQHGQLFWLDGPGEPVGAVLITDFFRSVQCDVLILPGDRGPGAAAWPRALRRVDALGVAAEFPVRSDDAAGLAALAGAGYRPAGEPGVVATWLAAADRPEVPALAPGFRFASRADAPDRPHPLAIRNGPGVETRLRQCSLYRADLDLAVEGPDGQVAGYGLFWADPVTRVGLVEPMRTEARYQRRGIARHILAAGLDRLAARGCARLKVSSDIGLYRQAGFEPWPGATLLSYVRPGARPARRR